MSNDVIKKKSQGMKKFLQEFDIRNDVEFGQLQHAYTYLKNMNLYIYKMRETLSQAFPQVEKGVRPSRECSEEVEALVDMGVRHSNAICKKVETNGYHAKVMRLEDAEKIFRLDNDLNMPNLPKTVIPYEKARRAIIKNPDRILLIECACRNSRGEKGCYPREVCMLMGEPWVTWGLENMQDSNPRLISQAEALEIIRAQHEAGNVQCAFFKDACGDRLYGICNCCTCCCVAMAAYNYADVPIFASSGYVRQTDTEKCMGCGDCVQACPVHACELVDSKTVIVSADKCVGCGVCAGKCSVNAIHMILDNPAVCQPFDVDELIPVYNKPITEKV